MPTSIHHDLDLHSPIVSMRFLGDPKDEFLAIAKVDGWTVDLWDEDYVWPADASVRDKSRIRTLQMRYDEITVRVRGGRVVSIGR